MTDFRFWEAFAVIVDDQLFGWRGRAFSNGRPRSTEARYPGGDLSGKYLPKSLPTYRVRVEVAEFDVGEGQRDMNAAVGNWYKRWPLHPDARGRAPDFQPSETVILPLREATFDLEVQRAPQPTPDSPIIFYWLPVDNVQRKPWRTAAT